MAAWRMVCFEALSLHRHTTTEVSCRIEGQTGGICKRLEVRFKRYDVARSDDEDRRGETIVPRRARERPEEKA